MRNRLRLAALLAIAVAAIISCAAPYDKFAETPLVLTIVETSDIHGALFPYNFITAKTADTSLAQVASLVAAERAKPGNEVVLLDNGDSLQGQPTVYFYNFEKVDVPHVWGEALNFMGYDAVSVGNHDIEAGHAVYDKLYAEMKAPALTANAVKADGQPYFKPYTIIRRQGVKIAILGLTSPKVPDWLPPQFWTGMQFEDMVESAAKWVKVIQEKEKPDVLIGLFHAGVDYTYGGVSADTKFNENATQLVAERVGGFDLIFAAHDHAGWSGLGYDAAAKKPGKTVVGPDGKVVPIYGALANASKIPVVRMELLWNKESKSWGKKIEGSLVDMKGVPADPAFTAKFADAFASVKTWVDRPIGKMDGRIDARDSMTGDSAFVDLIHTIQLEISKDPAVGLKKADISLSAPLDNTSVVPSSADGTLYVRDMFNLYKYENFLYTMDLTGEQVEKFLEFSYAGWFETMKAPTDQLINFAKDATGKLVYNERYASYDTKTRPYNYDSAAGIKYTVDVTKPAGDRVVILSMNDGTPFDLKKVYSVAINSYRGSGGGGHLNAGAGLDKEVIRTMAKVTGATTKDLRFYLLKWFEKQTGAVKVGADMNWKVIPEDLAKAGAANSLPLMYPAK